MSYYVTTTIITYTVDSTYVMSTNLSLVGDTSQFNVTDEQFKVVNILYSRNDTILDNLDAYVGGVYI